MRLGITELTHYIVVWFQDTSIPPAGKTSLASAVCRIKRHADGQFWTGVAWQAGVSSPALAEWDATNMPGVYRIAKPTVTVVTEVTVWVDAGTGTGITARYGIASFLIDPKVDLGTNLDAAISSVLAAVALVATSTDMGTVLDALLGDKVMDKKAKPWRYTWYKQLGSLLQDHDYTRTPTVESKVKR